MFVQVVHCHPLAESFSQALFYAVVETLHSRGHEVVATNLYSAGFDPVMTPTERRSYFAPAAYDDAAVRTHVDLLRRAEGLIYCFPQWWFSPPAVMKGYFDRVWGPGIAFEHDLARGRIRPLLTHVRLFGVVTSYGAPWWTARVLAGDPGRKMMMRALRPMCGPGVRSFYLAHYGMDRSTPRSREMFLRRVRATVASASTACQSTTSQPGVPPPRGRE